MTNNKQTHAKKVLAWRESLTKLSDQHFFDLFRMYLGEIKTPYNKQNLIEQLSSILRKEENKQNIIALLSYQDLLLLAALKVFEEARFTQLKIFFHDSFSSYDLEVHLQNLEERLLVFRTIDTLSEKQVYAINPLLENSLFPYIGANLLFPESKQIAEATESQCFLLNPQILASIYSFAFQNPDLCKLDGSLKKKFLQSLPDIFPQQSNVKCFETLLFALKNIGLIQQIENEVQLDYEKWDSFALLSELEQQAYIVAASLVLLPRASLVSLASILLAILNVLGQKLYTKKILKRIAFVFFEKASSETSISKSSAQKTIFQHGQTKDAENEFTSANLVDRVIDFGLLEPIGIDDEDEVLYRLRGSTKMSETKKLMHLDSGFFVSILPGLSLQSLISLAKAMDIVRCDTILSFEITKQSVTRAFEIGMSPQDFFAIFEVYSIHELPQNFYQAIQDWHNNFNSGSLYKGFVIHVDEDKIISVENNIVLKKHLLYTLAPGVYLMDFASDEEAHELVQKSGLDFIGRVKTLSEPVVNLPLSSLSSSSVDTILQINVLEEEKKATPLEEKEKNAVQKKLKEYLEKIDLTKEQKEDLTWRIKKKIIFSTEQIRPDSVRYVKTEAKGMDFLGKISIVEQAIASKLRIEIRYEGEKDENKIFLGKPLSIEKFTNDALVHLEVEEKKEPVQLSIGGASLVKLIRVSFVF